MQADKMVERKWAWFTMMRSNLKENVGAWQRHVNEYGPPGNHRYATRDSSKCGCPLIGKQCPFRADKVIDYDNDFGYPVSSTATFILHFHRNDILILFICVLEARCHLFHI
jgi:hypothetical protein